MPRRHYFITIIKRNGETFQVWLDMEDWLMAKDYPWHMSGGKGHVGKYAKNAKLGYMHRWVAKRMGILSENLTSKIDLDHDNGNKLDNRRCNIKLRTRSQNMSNTNDGLRATNKSGYRGVSFVKGREKFGKPWMAYVQANYTSKNLGWYATAEEAAKARRLWDEREK